MIDKVMNGGNAVILDVNGGNDVKINSPKSSWCQSKALTEGNPTHTRSQNKAPTDDNAILTRCKAGSNHETNASP